MSDDADARPQTLAPRPFRTLLAEHMGRNYAEFGDESGKVRLWHLGHCAAIFESTGSIHSEHADFIIEYHKKHIEGFERPWYTFGNWMKLDTYTPDTRRTLTNWQVEMSYDELYVAHNSRLLAMSINIANGLLKNTVVVVPNEEALDDVLLTIRARHKL